MQEYTNDEIIKVQMSQRALEGYTDDSEVAPLSHAERIAILAESPEALAWLENYNQYLGWLKGYVEARTDMSSFNPPF